MSQIFKCIACGSGNLLPADKGHACPSCRAFYPTKFGVSLFLKEVTQAPSGFEISDPMARSICRHAGIEETSDKLSRVKEIFRHNYHLSDIFLDAENNYYLERVRAAMDEAVRDEGLRPTMADRMAGIPINEDIRAKFTAHYIPSRLTAGRTISRNVRFTNTGSSIISSNHPTPVYLSYHWRDANGKILEWEGERTQLLIDLVPGQSLTMPIFFKTPAKAQSAYLELTFVQEQVAWHDEFRMCLAVEIVPEETNVLPPNWQALPAAENYDYGEDHEQGRQILLAEVERRRQPGMRALEVGGCCNPMAVRMGLEIVNIDIDVQTLQVGALTPYDEKIHWVASDAHELPFAEESFHIIVMFAALHHFVDPVRVLRQLKPLLKPNGFLTIMCEPVGHNVAPAPEGMVNELIQGINEQAFSLQEYDLIFDQAGLEAYDLVAHGHSLKALLRPASKPMRTCLARHETQLPLPALKQRWMNKLRTYWRRAG